jgi:hypothetical protein
MESIDKWLVELNKNSHVWFGVVTVVTMSGLGILIAVATELVFKLFGIKGERIDSHH